MIVTIFEDNSYNSLFPLNINRASFELRCGAFTNLDRIINNLSLEKRKMTDCGNTFIFFFNALEIHKKFNEYTRRRI